MNFSLIKPEPLSLMLPEVSGDARSILCSSVKDTLDSDGRFTTTYSEKIASQASEALLDGMASPVDMFTGTQTTISSEDSHLKEEPGDSIMMEHHHVLQDSPVSHDTSIKLEKQMSKAKSILRAERLPRVGGVCFDKNRQRWIAHWKVSGKYVKNYFPVNHYGFDQARCMAIQCRHEAEKRLNLPPIQSRQSIAPTASTVDFKREVNPADSAMNNIDNGNIRGDIDREIASGGGKIQNSHQNSSIDPFYDGRKKCWVASYTVVEQFPVSVYGYNEARRRAFECRRAHEKMREDSKPHGASEAVVSSRGRPAKKNEDTAKKSGEAAFDMGISQNKHSLVLTQEAIYIVLNDLHESCLPALSGKVSQVLLKKYDNVLCYHKNVVKAASSMVHVKVYLSLFQRCILEHLLPSDRTESEQRQMLSDLLQNMVDKISK